VGRRGVVRRRAVRAGRATFYFNFRAPGGSFVLFFSSWCVFAASVIFAFLAIRE
jgi:hypothetical protein